MNALNQFRAQLPEWLPRWEAWLNSLPTSIGMHPGRAGCLYLLDSPPLVDVGAANCRNLDPWWVDWDRLAVPSADNQVIGALVRAGHELERGDPGPALALMLLRPAEHAFWTAHAAGTIAELVRRRTEALVFPAG